MSHRSYHVLSLWRGILSLHPSPAGEFSWSQQCRGWPNNPGSRKRDLIWPENVRNKLLGPGKFCRFRCNLSWSNDMSAGDIKIWSNPRATAVSPRSPAMAILGSTPGTKLAALDKSQNDARTWLFFTGFSRSPFFWTHLLLLPILHLCSATPDSAQVATESSPAALHWHHAPAR